MIKIAFTVLLSDEDVREIGDYLLLNYPPIKDQRQHSVNWARKQIIKTELEDVVNRRLVILRKNVANFMERRTNEWTTGSIPD